MLQLDQEVKVSFYINKFNRTKSALKIVNGKLTFTDLLINWGNRKKISSEKGRTKSCKACDHLKHVLSNRSTKCDLEKNNNCSGPFDYKGIIRHIPDLNIL